MSRVKSSTWTRRGSRLALRWLGWLPFRVVARLFALLSLAHLALEPRRLQGALAWAEAQGRTGLGKWKLALTLMSNRGYFTAARTIGAFLDPEQMRGLVRLEGREHLEPTEIGTILLSFHLGPMFATWTLMAYRYDFAGTGSGHTAGLPYRLPAWRGARTSTYIHWPGTGEAARAIGLYRIRRVLLSGHTVKMAGDGMGVEIFPIRVPGGIVSIKSGWWTLRRLTGARVIPILEHREGSGFVLVACPPLPPPAADPEEDLRICHAALARLIEEQVKRFPEQCDRSVCMSTEDTEDDGPFDLADWTIRDRDRGQSEPIRGRTGEA
jgi:lauroyl/myristoyl acyltransferase